MLILNMRRRESKRRVIAPDRKYNDVLVSKMINNIMLNGKKSIAEKIFYPALENAAQKSNLEPLDFFHKIIDKVGPAKFIVGRKYGGNTYQIPRETKIEDRPLLGIKLLVKSFRTVAWTEGKRSTVILENILLQSFQGSGPAVSAKEKLHKTAEENAAFSHFAW